MRRETNQKKPPHIAQSRPERISATVPTHSTWLVCPLVQKPYKAAAPKQNAPTMAKILYSVLMVGASLLPGGNRRVRVPVVAGAAGVVRLRRHRELLRAGEADRAHRLLRGLPGALRRQELVEP